MRKICSVCLFCFIVATASPVFSDAETKKLIRECVKPTVTVEFPGHLFGTGAIVRSERAPGGGFINAVVSCNHIVGEGTCTVKYYRHDKDHPSEWSDDYPATVYARSVKRDFSIVIFYTKEKMPTAMLDLKTKPERGMRLWSVGTAIQRMPPRIEEGKIHHLVDDEIVGSALLVSGDSGGPAFTLIRGRYRIIGVNSSVVMVNNNIVSAIAHYKSMLSWREWCAESEGRLDFTFDKHKKMPVLPGIFLKVEKLTDHGLDEYDGKHNQP